MMFQSIKVGALVACVALAGCAQGAGTGGTQMGDACGNLGWGKLGGAAVGGALGGLAGNQIGKGSGNALATALGAGAGLLLGGAAGSRLDDVDCMKAQQARGQALNPATPIGQTIEWSTPGTAQQGPASGTFTPVREGKDKASGQYCREYEQTITVGGEKQKGFGTACRQPDGSWKIVS